MKEDEKNGMHERTAEEILKAKLKNIHFIRSDETYALVLEAMEEYRTLSKVEQVEQDLSAIDEAIKYFEDLKTKAVKLHELVFFDVVLAVLDGIKTKRLTRRSSTVESLEYLEPDPGKHPEKRYTFDQMMDFVKWYSGMENSKVVAAYVRYIREVKPEHPFKK